MISRFRLCLFGLVGGISIPGAAMQDDRQPGPRTARWTTAGWYLVEYRGGGTPDLLRAGPFAAEAACVAARQGVDPLAPRGHPELDLLECRELKVAPPA